VANLNIYDLIGWSPKNIGRFTVVNEHCSFPTVNRLMFFLIPAGLRGGKSGVKPVGRKCCGRMEEAPRDGKPAGDLLPRGAAA